MSESAKSRTSFWTSLVQKNGMIKPLIETKGIFSIIRFIERFFNNAYFGWLRCCCITMLCFYCVGAFAGSPQAPSDTRIIDNFSSLGIDQPQPRFGWILHDKERGHFKTAF